jgi:hypothetical protein
LSTPRGDTQSHAAPQTHEERERERERMGPNRVAFLQQHASTRDQPLN